MESLRHIGIFEIYESPGYTSGQINEFLQSGESLAFIPGIGRPVIRKNLLMATQKLLMAQAVYPNIDKLVITNQTSTPGESETSYSGAIYTTDPGDEAFRSGATNPYQLIWNIPQASANGAWGSFVLINSSGDMINRALAGVSKSSSQGKIVTFTGTVV